jgi:hypothetical protein
VRALIHRLYGTPLQPRLVALCGAALAVEDAPPPAALPEEPPPAPPPVPSGFARDDAEPLEPLAAALAQALESVDPLSLEEGPQGEGEEPMGQEGEERGRAPEAPADRSAPPRWSLDAARAALSTARHRDDVVLAALRYARDFFEFAAMFAVTRDAVAGHDALGAEEARARARDVAIWSSDPGIFRTVIETESPYLGPVVPGAAGTDAVLHGLGRTPRTVLVYPVLLRHRPVCILYADNGEAPVSARRLGDLLLFLSGLGQAFERIIVDRKGGPRRGSPQEPTPADAGSSAQNAQTAEVAPGQPVPAAPAVAVAEPGPVAAEEREPEPAAVASAETEQTLPEAGGATEPRRGAEEGGGAPPSPPAEPLPPEPEPEPEPAAADSLAALDERLFVEPRDVAAPERSAQQPAVPEEQAGPPAAGAPLPEPEPGAVAAAPEASRAPPSPPEPRPAPAPTPPPVAAPPDPATLCALADRALDADVDIASAACAALGARRRDRAIRQASERLRRALLSGISGRSARAARAIGALRDVEAIPLLIQVLETSEPETAQAAADALAAITLQRIGPDARRWLGWWKANRGRGRAEWLFSGLTSAERETRVAASVELSLAAPPPVAYSADMPPAEREKAARAWAGWWTRSGNVL